MSRSKLSLLSLSAILGLALSGTFGIACAQSYPAKPIRMLVPFPPGASNDIFARLIAQKLSEAFGTWFAIVAPAATPKPVIARLNAEIVKAINAADTRKRFLELATDPVSSTPDELAAYNRTELAKWKKVIESAGIKPE